MPEYHLTIGCENPYIDTEMQNNLTALVAEHFDVPQNAVRIDVEEILPGRRHPVFNHPYRAYVRFDADLPPDEKIFFSLLEPLQKITRSADVSCNFLSLPLSPLVPNHIKMRRSDGKGLEENDRDALATLLAEHGHADCTVEFIGADGLLIKGLSLSELVNHTKLQEAMDQRFHDIELSAVSAVEIRDSGGKGRKPPYR